MGYIENLSNRVEDAYGSFSKYAPVWLSNGDYGLRMWQGFKGRIIERTFEDPLNGNLGNPDNILIEYRLGKKKESLFKVKDFNRLQEWIESSKQQRLSSFESNLLGMLSERIAWYSTYTWLSKLEGTLINDPYEEEHIFGNTDEYILKVKNSPNLLMLRKKNKTPSSYEQIKELDGLFIYNHDKDDYVVVLETKMNGMSIGIDNVIDNLFRPLKDIYPNHKQIYLLYTDMGSVYKGGSSKESRRANMNSIKEEPKKIFTRLLEENIGTIFFGFREKEKSFKGMTEHIFNHVRLIENLPTNVTATITQKKIVLWGGSSPLLILMKNEENYWEEKPIRR